MGLKNGLWVGDYHLDGRFHLLRLSLNRQGGYLIQGESEFPQPLLDLRQQAAQVHFRVKSPQGALTFNGVLKGVELRGRVTSEQASGDFIVQPLASAPVSGFDQFLGHYQVSPQREILVSRGDLAGQYFYWDGGRYGRLPWHLSSTIQLGWLLFTAGVLGTAFGLLWVAKPGLSQISIDSLFSNGTTFIDTLQALTLLSSMLTLVLVGVYLRSLALSTYAGQVDSFDPIFIYRILPGFIVLPVLSLSLLALALFGQDRAQPGRQSMLLRFLLTVFGTLSAIGWVLYWA